MGVQAPLTRRQMFGVAAPGILLALSLGTAIGAARVARGPGDRIMVLGSGDAVSVLMATETTGVLLACGTHATDFGNAYAQTGFVPRRAPDVLLLAGTGREANAAGEAIRMFDQARRYTLASDSPLAFADDTMLDFLPTNPAQLTLDGRMTLVVETSPQEDTPSQVAAWRITATRENARVVIVSAQDAIEHFAWPDPSSVAIVSMGPIDNPTMLRDATGATAIVGPASSVDARLVTEESRGEDELATQVVPVRPGSLATISFQLGNVRLTGHDVVHLIPWDRGNRSDASD